MKILITGGAGFIGSNLVDKLIQEKHSVIVLDNLITGKKENIHPQAKFLKTDITNFSQIDKIFSQEKPEIIYHLAAQIDVRQSVINPLVDAQVNILAGLNLIKLAHQYKVKKIIFSSSGGAIYGDTDLRPTTENHSEWPLSPYGIAKLTIDKYLNYFHQVHGLKYTSLRYANVYGPRQNSQGEAGVIAIFINQMLNKKQPLINGTGKQTRDYVFVEDVVQANFLALEKITKVGVYNVGTGKETSVNQIFTQLNQHFGNQFKKVFAPAKLGEQKTSCLDASKIKADFGWQPQFNLITGLAKTVTWFQKNN